MGMTPFLTSSVILWFILLASFWTLFLSTEWVKSLKCLHETRGTLLWKSSQFWRCVWWVVLSVRELVSVMVNGSPLFMDYFAIMEHWFSTVTDPLSRKSSLLADSSCLVASSLKLHRIWTTQCQTLTVLLLSCHGTMVLS